LKRFLPFLHWPRPTGDTIRTDLLAGFAVSLHAIPQSIAYAQLAGVTAHYGLYAALIPSVVGVLFGSSYVLSTGPVAPTSLLTGASVGQILHGMTAVFGLLAMVLLVAFKRLAPRLPGVLVTMAILTLLTQASGFAAGGGAIIGRIPGGLPDVSIPAGS